MPLACSQMANLLAYVMFLAKNSLQVCLSAGCVDWYPLNSSVAAFRSSAAPAAGISSPSSSTQRSASSSMRLVSGPTDTALQFVIESHQPKNVPYTVKQYKVVAITC